MSDARERMIDAAVRAFGEDLERKESARKWLDDTAVLSDDDNAAETTERFDELDAHRKRLPWRRL